MYVRYDIICIFISTEYSCLIHTFRYNELIFLSWTAYLQSKYSIYPVIFVVLSPQTRCVVHSKYKNCYDQLYLLSTTVLSAEIRNGWPCLLLWIDLLCNGSTNSRRYHDHEDGFVCWPVNFYTNETPFEPQLTLQSVFTLIRVLVPLQPGCEFTVSANF